MSIVIQIVFIYSILDRFSIKTIIFLDNICGLFSFFLLNLLINQDVVDEF